MTDKKFTDEEIIKVLECCAYNDGCKGCKYSKQCDGASYLIDALDLINRQKSEIERLKSANNEKFRQWDMLAEKKKQHCADLYEEAKDILKAEAYKEFAERLKKQKGLFHYLGLSKTDYAIAVEVSTIDNLLKEMVGEEE